MTCSYLPYRREVYKQKRFQQRRDAEQQREMVRCHSVHTIKVCRMQPSDGEYGIIWRGYMSVKFAKRLNTWR